MQRQTMNPSLGPGQVGILSQFTGVCYGTGRNRVDKPCLGVAWFSMAAPSAMPSRDRSAAKRQRTFRPPYFHRNVMSEFMGLVRGEYDAKKGGFVPGGASLHNAMSAHGPDRASYDKALAAKLEPQYLADTLAFMFESRYLFEATQFALSSPTLDRAYDAAWEGFQKSSLSPGRGPGRGS